jgi:hypothetical protein
MDPKMDSGMSLPRDTTLPKVLSGAKISDFEFSALDIFNICGEIFRREVRLLFYPLMMISPFH